MADFIAENMNLSQVLRRIKDNKKEISNLESRISNESYRLSSDISTETERAKSVEATLASDISTETERAKFAEEANASAIARLTTTTNTATQKNIYSSHDATPEEGEWDGSTLFLATTETITEDNFENFSILVRYYQTSTLFEEVTYKLSELEYTHDMDIDYLYGTRFVVPAPNENYASSSVVIVHDTGAYMQYYGYTFSSKGVYLGRKTSDSGIYTNVYRLTEWGYESTVVINNELLDLPNNTDFKALKTKATSANTLALEAHLELNNKADKLENTSVTDWCVPMYRPRGNTPQLVVASNEALGGAVVMSDNDGNISLPSVDKIKGSDEGGNDNRAASIAKVKEIIEDTPTKPCTSISALELPFTRIEIPSDACGVFDLFTFPGGTFTIQSGIDMVVTECTSGRIIKTTVLDSDLTTEENCAFVEVWKNSERYTYVVGGLNPIIIDSNSLEKPTYIIKRPLTYVAWN